MVPLQSEPVRIAFVWALAFAVAVIAAVWVFVDSGLRGMGRGRVTWALGSFAALPIVLPLYLLVARPIGALVICPHCATSTLSNRAACAQCGGPLAADPVPATWGAGEIIGIVLFFFSALLVVLATTGVSSEAITLQTFAILILLQNNVLGGLSIYVVRWRYRQPLAALGLRWASLRTLAGAGLGIGLAAVPISVVSGIAAKYVIGAIIGHGRAEVLAATEEAKQVLFTVLQGSLTGSQLAWLIVLVCVVVPIGEEIFFRGFIFGALRGRLPTAIAVGLSALLFALAHTEVFHFYPIFVLGVILAMLYERTHSLLPGMVVHGVNNVVAMLAFLYKVNV